MKAFKKIKQIHDRSMGRLTTPMANKPWSTARRIFGAGFLAGVLVAAASCFIFMNGVY